MQVTPSGESPFLTPPTPNAPDFESARFASRDTVVLPDEVFIKILMNLGTTDIAVCRSVNRHWQTVIDTGHLLARSFYRDCHLTQRINSLAVERNLAVERYHSHIRGWLADFGNGGRETAKQLDNILKNKYFPEALFFSIPKLLLNSNELTYQNTVTIGHLGEVEDASFSPDGKYLVTVSDDNAARLWEIEGGQWREKVALRHSAWVNSASFSPNGKLLVTASSDCIGKIWRLEDDQWQEKAAIQYCHISLRLKSVRNASFSPDGNHLVIVSDGGSAKIWWHVDGKWQDKGTIEHSVWGVTDAQFSPDGKHLVTAFVDGTVKIWKFNDSQWEEKFTIQHPESVSDARFSPDGKHLVTVASGVSGVTPGDRIDYHHAKLWELADDQSQEEVTSQQWQEKATIEHSDVVDDAHFSPDGKHLVTADRDGAVKICELGGGKWQVKATIWHSGPVLNASFSRDGKFLVTASCDHTTKICRLVGGKWQEVVTIRHSKLVRNASFSPDYQLVTPCGDNTVKIWVLKNKENDDNSELVTSL